MNAANLAQWGISSLIVIIYALKRFETPSPARGTTTFVRYSLAKCCYVLSMLLLFILLGGGLTDSAPLLALVAKGVEKDASLPGPLYAALLLTALLPNVPILSRIDEWIKQEFQRIGNIPFEVRQLSARLQQTRLELNPNLYPSFHDDLRDAGVDEAWFNLPNDRLEARWSRIVALRLSPNSWRELRGYSAYLADREEQLKDIDERYKALGASLDETGALKGAVTTTSIAATLARQLRRQITDLNKSLCDFIAGGVLQCEWSRGDRETKLRTIGFARIDELRSPLGVNEVLLVGSIVFVVMNAIVLAFRNYAPDDLARALYVAAMVAIIYTIAIVIAIYPKTMWRAADIQHTRSRPFGAYVLSGVAAAVVAFFIAVAFKYVFVTPDKFIAPDHFRSVLTDTALKWPWMLMTLGATVSTTWAADDYATDPGQEPGWLRWAEAFALAAIFCALQWYVCELLVGQGFKEYHDRQLQFLLTSTTIGGCIGFLVPHLYRKGNAEARAAQDPKPAPQPSEAARAVNP